MSRKKYFKAFPAMAANGIYDREIRGSAWFLITEYLCSCAAGSFDPAVI